MEKFSPKKIDGMEISFITITPSMAKEILDNSVGSINYKLLDNCLVTGYAFAMEIGKWDFRGDSIKLTSDGILVDGLHRLKAIIQCGIPQIMIVAKGVEPNQNTLKTNAKGEVTLKSLKNYLDSFAAKERWNKFAIVTENYNMSYKTFYKMMTYTYSDIPLGYDRLSVYLTASKFNTECFDDLPLTKQEREFILSKTDDDNCITLYRGCCREEVEEGSIGLSWSTDKTTAEWFAKEYQPQFVKGGTPTVITTKVDIDDILGVLLDKEEYEVMVAVNADDVKIVV